MGSVPQRGRIERLLDASKPNPGRVYDYWLGGHHNFLADRLMGKVITRMDPSVPYQVRMVRWFLKLATNQLVEQGFDKFLDLASGLPTVDHIHETAPPGTKVIYSDIDPIVVAYGQEIIGDNPHVRFVQADCRRPEELLESPVVPELFGDDRRVAIVFNGIIPYLEADEMRHTMRVLHNWAAEGSCLALSTPVMMTPEPTPLAQEFVEMYRKRMDSPFNVWPLAALQELLSPWQPDERGFCPATEWLGVDHELIRKTVVEGTGWMLYGAFLVK